MELTDFRFSLASLQITLFHIANNFKKNMFFCNLTKVIYDFYEYSVFFIYLFFVFLFSFISCVSMPVCSSKKKQNIILFQLTKC